LQLPHQIGTMTLLRSLGTDGLSESFVAILDDPAGQTVVARRVFPSVLKDPARLVAYGQRVGDLVALDHPTVVRTLGEVHSGDDHYVLEAWTPTISAAQLIRYLQRQGREIPPNVFLHLVTQACNALEAVHARTGAVSQVDGVLHLALAPEHLRITADGQVLLGGFGFVRSPLGVPTDPTAPVRLAYLSPEQTHLDQKLGPPSDIFALGAVMFELLIGRPMFQADSPLQTIHKIRRAEITPHLLEVKLRMPGLDRVLYRALSLNPRHRYQRAFVLREDLRGLMAGYSFSDIEGATRALVAPAFHRDGTPDPNFAEPSKPTGATPVPVGQRDSIRTHDEDTASLLDAHATTRIRTSSPPSATPRSADLPLATLPTPRPDDPGSSISLPPPLAGPRSATPAPVPSREASSGTDTTWMHLARPLTAAPSRPPAHEVAAFAEERPAAVAPAPPLDPLDRPPSDDAPEPQEQRVPARSQDGRTDRSSLVWVLVFTALTAVAVLVCGGLLVARILTVRADAPKAQPAPTHTAPAETPAEPRRSRR